MGHGVLKIDSQRKVRDPKSNYDCNPYEDNRVNGKNISVSPTKWYSLRKLHPRTVVFTAVNNDKYGDSYRALFILAGCKYAQEKQIPLSASRD
ncbi:hypothetical protein POVWA2_030350 [Plasmodium ovale wallikeri]|uniref:Uncharacterized protein n=1 Tax=Plasmodium ovale wallikeri TaxID=864142 RepID=A0A1A8YXL4_PLAOA|nr:hypothetical protein POVWA1_030760 [Plasmodium ovale wallikeri]SBT36459.1 hypothetical protein POVWA2_030350 [Plasmodium ovale wallikeri]